MLTDARCDGTKQSEKTMALIEKYASATLDRDREPSFVDLRAFAAFAEPSLRNDDRADTEFLSSRFPLPVAGDDGPVSAVFLPAGSGNSEKMTRDEFIVLLKGSLHLSDGGQDHRLQAGDAAVIPHGSAFAWHADADVLAATLSYEQSEPAGRAITPIRKDPVLAASAKPAADVLLGPAPDCRNHNDYRVDDGKFVCGTWDSTAYRRRGFFYGHNEIMLINQGSVTLSDQRGRMQNFAEGSLVLVEAGSHVAWDSREHVTKVFAIYRV